MYSPKQAAVVIGQHYPVAMDEALAIVNSALHAEFETQQALGKELTEDQATQILANLIDPFLSAVLSKAYDELPQKILVNMPDPTNTLRAIVTELTDEVANA